MAKGKESIHSSRLTPYPQPTRISLCLSKMLSFKDIQDAASVLENLPFYFQWNNGNNFHWPHVLFLTFIISFTPHNNPERQLFLPPSYRWANRPAPFQWHAPGCHKCSGVIIWAQVCLATNLSSINKQQHLKALVIRAGRVVQNKYEAIPLRIFYYYRKVDKARSMSGWDDQEVIGKITLEAFLKR